MAETFVCPSELHLKKELGAARKARCLRDPETCSSRRSDLASRSMAAYPGLNCGDDIELELASALPSTNGTRSGKVYLYNWVHHSRKSSDSGIKMDGEIKENPVDIAVNPVAEETLPDEPSPCPPPSKTSRLQRAATRKSIRKSRRAPLLKRRTVKASARAKLFDPPSSTYETLNSSDHHSEGDAQNSAQRELIQAKRFASSPDSPLISGSGCRNWSVSSRVLRTVAKDESSYSITPTSASSIDRCLRKRHPASGFSSSKRGKDRGCGGWYSPSLSDTLKRKGTSILCGSQIRCQKSKSSGVGRQYKSPPTNSGAEDQYLMDMDATSDEASTHFEELDLEPVSGLDGSRWPERKIRREGSEEEMILPRHRSLSQKYRPRSFDEIIGQNIVVQSLRSATLKGRIAPAYLFHGPRGTGKTSTARIFAAALICLATAENKPCGFCRECVDFASGNGSPNVRELDAGDKKGVHEITNVLKSMHRLASSSSSRRQVLIIDECHALPSKIWPTLIRFLEEPPLRAVFLLIATDPDTLPRAILSRCQKYLFPKIKDADAVRRLRMLSSKEGLEVEPDALGLIALNSDGSLRDAETMLEQLSLLGKKITTSLVNDLVGLVADEKLVDLLETAMSSNTSETVRRCRELLDSGVDPMVLTSQLAGVIMDTIAGMHGGAGASSNETLLRGRSLTTSEVGRLQEALKVLSDAEKQLRLSSERSTWFTAAMLQLGCGRSPTADRTSGSSKHSLPEASLMNSHLIPGGNHPSRKRPGSERIRDLIPACSEPADGSRVLFEACEEKMNESFIPKSRSRREKLDEIWRMCIENCHSNALRQLLFAHGQVLSISQAEGAAVVSLAFDDESTTNRAEGYSSSITNSMEMVLGQRVRIRIRCVSMGMQSKTGLRETQKRSKDDSDVLTGMDSRESFSYSAARRSADCGETRLSRRRTLEICGEGSGVANSSTGKGGWRSGSREEAIEELTRMKQKSVVVDDQRTVAGSTMKAERNQILPQTGAGREPSKHWEDALSQEMKALQIGSDSHLRDQFKEPAFSPSFLRQSTLDKESRWWGSGRGCSGLLCWKQASRRGKRASNSGARCGRLPRLGACLKPVAEKRAAAKSSDRAFI